MKKILQQENAAYFKLPTFEEIPDVGLYLEQTATFINKYLEPLLGSELTPSMIRNYLSKSNARRIRSKPHTRIFVKSWNRPYSQSLKSKR